MIDIITDSIDLSEKVINPPAFVEKKRGSYTLSVTFDLMSNMNPLVNALIDADIPFSITPHNDGTKLLEAYGNEKELRDIVEAYVIQPQELKCTYKFDCREI